MYNITGGKPMPLRTLKYVVIDADTRTMEFFTALFTILYGFWMEFVDRRTAQLFFNIVDRLGGKHIWFVLAIFAGCSMLFAIYYQYPKWRARAASIAALFWIVFSVSIFLIDCRTFYTWMGFAFTCASLWIVMHRTALAQNK